MNSNLNSPNHFNDQEGDINNSRDFQGQLDHQKAMMGYDDLPPSFQFHAQNL